MAWSLCFVELAERASYYGVKAVFNNYIQFPLPEGGPGTGAINPNNPNGHAGALNMGLQASSALTLLFTFLSYCIPIFGAWIADTKIGRYQAIVWGVLIGGLAHIIMRYVATPCRIRGSVCFKVTCLTGLYSLCGYRLTPSQYVDHHPGSLELELSANLKNPIKMIYKRYKDILTSYSWRCCAGPSAGRKRSRALPRQLLHPRHRSWHLQAQCRADRHRPVQVPAGVHESAQIGGEGARRPGDDREPHHADLLRLRQRGRVLLHRRRLHREVPQLLARVPSTGNRVLPSADPVGRDVQADRSEGAAGLRPDALHQDHHHRAEGEQGKPLR